MMRTMLLSSLLGVVACSSAHADDQAFTNFIAAMKKHTNRLPSPVSVSAVGAVEGRELVLRFAVTNRLKKTLTLYPFELPWGGTYATATYWRSVIPSMTDSRQRKRLP